MYAVMGVTGQVGGAVAERLLATGAKVRAVVRNREKAAAWAERGAEVAVADYNDADGLTAAFRGAEGVFAMIPPNFTPSPDFREARATIAAVAGALDRTRPGKAVYLSSIGAQQASRLGLITSLHLLEEAMRALPTPGAFLRAGWFMENCEGGVEPARTEGKLYSNLQPLDRGFPLVATADIGTVGADVLRQSWSGNRFLEVGGPRRYSASDIAEALGRALGRSVQAVAVPRENWVKMFVAQGMPEDRTSPRVEMLDGFNSGWIDFGVPGTEHFEGSTELIEVVERLVEKRRKGAAAA